MSDTADIVWLTAPGEIEVRREPLPPCGSRDVRCETIVTVISPGTELAAWKGLPPLRPGVTCPRLQGYCSVARVVETGIDTESVRVGDRVLTFQSHRSAFVIPDSEILARLPDEIDATRAATAYLFHLGYNAVLLGGVRAGSRVAVVGGGVLGLTSLAMAGHAGADAILVSDHAPRGPRTVPRADAESRRDCFDVVISTTNAWRDWTLALDLATQRGTIAVLGFPGRGEPAPTDNPLDSRWFYTKQLTIRAVGMSPELPDPRGFARFNERDNLRSILAWIAEGALDAEMLVSARYPGLDIASAYRDLAKRKDNAITFALDWSR